MRHLPENYTLESATGNGSCGPNSLAIIFVSYLLNDFYSSCNIDLLDFMTAWNLYYSDDPISVDDLNLDDPTGHQQVSSAVKNHIIKRLRVESGGSFRDAEKLIAPVIRFHHLLITMIRRDNLGPYDRTMTRFFRGVETHSSIYYWNCRHPHLSEYIESAKIMMSHAVYSDQFSNDLTRDNSPSYWTFFNEYGMTDACALLGLTYSPMIRAQFRTRIHRSKLGEPESLRAADNVSQQILYAYSGDNRTTNQRIQYIQNLTNDPQNTFYIYRSEALPAMNPAQALEACRCYDPDISGPPPTLYAWVVNSNLQHFDACLPNLTQYECTDNHVYNQLIQNTRDKKCADYRSDSAVYNPAKRNYFIRCLPIPFAEYLYQISDKLQTSCRAFFHFLKSYCLHIALFIFTALTAFSSVIVGLKFALTCLLIVAAAYTATAIYQYLNRWQQTDPATTEFVQSANIKEKQRDNVSQNGNSKNPTSPYTSAVDIETSKRSGGPNK